MPIFTNENEFVGVLKANSRIVASFYDSSYITSYDIVIKLRRYNISTMIEEQVFNLTTPLNSLQTINLDVDISQYLKYFFSKTADKDVVYVIFEYSVSKQGSAISGTKTFKVKQNAYSFTPDKNKSEGINAIGRVTRELNPFDISGVELYCPEGLPFELDVLDNKLTNRFNGSKIELREVFKGGELVDDTYNYNAPATLQTTDSTYILSSFAKVNQQIKIKVTDAPTPVFGDYYANIKNVKVETLNVPYIHKFRFINKAGLKSNAWMLGSIKETDKYEFDRYMLSNGMASSSFRSKINTNLSREFEVNSGFKDDDFFEIQKQMLLSPYVEVTRYKRGCKAYFLNTYFNSINAVVETIDCLEGKLDYLGIEDSFTTIWSKEEEYILTPLSTEIKRQTNRDGLVNYTTNWQEVNNYIW